MTNLKECVSYIQLSIGWLVLCLSTLSLCAVPESAVFYGISHTLNVENIVIYGFLVLTEIGFFVILLVMYIVLLLRWNYKPSKTG